MKRLALPLLLLASTPANAQQWKSLETLSHNGDCSQYDSEITGPWLANAHTLQHGTMHWKLERQGSKQIATFGWPAYGLRAKVTATIENGTLDINTDYACHWRSITTPVNSAVSWYPNAHTVSWYYQP